MPAKRRVDIIPYPTFRLPAFVVLARVRIIGRRALLRERWQAAGERWVERKRREAA